MFNPDFSRQLIQDNRLVEAGFDRWALYPGMLFRSPDKWWGDWGRRPRPHEGVDLCLYTNESGDLFELDESARIPVILDGTVMKLEKDYLGHSVYVEHGIHDGHGRRLWTMYGHTRPADHVRPGEGVRQGEIIATLTKKKEKTTGPRPHLHLTMAWVSQERGRRELNWETLHDPEIAILFDPLQPINAPYRILDPEVP
jgi:murein DD-endopeptidase MepM/ murein hydrolase activator NlpD